MYKDCLHLVEAIGTAICEAEVIVFSSFTFEVARSSKENGFWMDFPLFFYQLPYQFCYTHRHYLNSCRNFTVLSIQLYQLYAYPNFWV
jgi:hypothetical protein